MAKTGFYQKRQLAYEWLKTTYPEVFARDTPLKVGIHRDILAIEKADKPANIYIRHAIAMHTNRVAYLRRLKQGVERLDLQGKGCDQFVSEKEAIIAKEKVLELHHHYQNKNKLKQSPSTEKDSAAQAKPEQQLDKPGKKILSLKTKKGKNTSKTNVS